MLPAEIVMMIKMLAPLIALVFLIPLLIKRSMTNDDPVEREIKKHLDPQKYHVIRDVTVRTRNMTSSADYVITSEHGIFVLQRVEITGSIEGQPGYTIWTANRVNKKKKFQNPLLTNIETVNLLRSRYNHPDNYYFSLAVFTGRVKFKSTMPNNVRTLDSFCAYVKSKKERLIPAEDALEIYQQIKEGHIPNTLKTYNQYLDHARKIFQEQGSEEEEKQAVNA